MDGWMVRETWFESITYLIEENDHVFPHIIMTRFLQCTYFVKMNKVPLLCSTQLVAWSIFSKMFTIDTQYLASCASCLASIVFFSTVVCDMTYLQRLCDFLFSSQNSSCYCYHLSEILLTCPIPLSFSFCLLLLSYLQVLLSYSGNMIKNISTALQCLTFFPNGVPFCFKISFRGLSMWNYKESILLFVFIIQEI